jgi:hypothetical protein
MNEHLAIAYSRSPPAKALWSGAVPTKRLLPHLLGVAFAVPHKLNYKFGDHHHYRIVALDQVQIGQQLVERRRHDGDLLRLERAAFFFNKLVKGLRWHDFPWPMGSASGESVARVHGRIEFNGTLPDNPRELMGHFGHGTGLVRVCCDFCGLIGS